MLIRAVTAVCRSCPPVYRQGTRLTFRKAGFKSRQEAIKRILRRPMRRHDASFSLFPLKLPAPTYRRCCPSFWEVAELERKARPYVRPVAKTLSTLTQVRGQVSPLGTGLTVTGRNGSMHYFWRVEETVGVGSGGCAPGGFFFNFVP